MRLLLLLLLLLEYNVQSWVFRLFIVFLGIIRYFTVFYNKLRKYGDFGLTNILNHIISL